MEKLGAAYYGRSFASFNLCIFPFSAYESLVFISVGVVLLPSPGILAHLPDAVPGFPVQLLFGKACVRVAGGDVPGSSGLDCVWNLYPDRFTLVASSKFLTMSSTL